MKIVQVRKYTAPAKNTNGVERLLESLAVELQNQGHNVSLLCNPDSTTNIVPLVSKIEDDVDIVHYHGHIPNEWDHKIPQNKWISTCHAGPLPSPEDAAMYAKYKDNFVGVSKHVCKTRNMFLYVYNGLNPDDFRFNENPDDYFLWLGGTDWGEQKALFSSIQLAKKLKLKLKIAGTGENHQNIEMVKSLCDNKIEFLGPVNGEEKKNLLANAKATLMIGTVLDACPVTSIESLMSGTPVIARSVGAHPEMLNDKVGVLCNNDIEIVKAILNVKKIDRKECRKHAIENFSIEKCAKNYVKIYRYFLRHLTVKDFI